MSTIFEKSFNKPPQSYWMASIQQPEYPVLNEDIKVDIAIVGGGMVGITTAYMLKKQGINAVILEADRILQGTTGHTTAKITSQHELIYSKLKKQMGEELAKQYADANETSIKTIEKIICENNIECDYTPQSAYVFTQDENYLDQMHEEVETASSLGIKAAFVEEIPFSISIKGAVRFDDQAQFHPLKFLHPLAQKLKDEDVQIFEQSRVVDIEENGNYVLTTNHKKKVTAEKVIIASHYPFYNKHGLYFGRLYTERSYALAIKAKEKYPGGMYINIEEPARSLRSVTSDQGELIIVGGDHHKTGQSRDTVIHYEALKAFANTIFTVEDYPYRWSTQDCMTMDGVPYVGHYTSKTPNLYIATGFGKWGMTNSIAAATILSDLIVKGDSPWKDVYNPSRHTITASAKNFVVENLNVAKELIGGKLSIAPAKVDIKPGEGKVFEINGQKTGAYRDEQGTLHIVDTTCTHMGCELSWNSAEKTWDCPCHGSRFTYEGDIVEGPTVTPLKVHKDVNTIEKLLKDDF